MASGMPRPCFAMPSAFRKIDASPPIFAHDFEHGLALRVLPEPEAKGGDGVDVVSVQVWIGSGAAQEKDSESGMAHFMEHLVFKPWAEPLQVSAGKGQGRVEVCDLAGGIEELGGDSNAYTSYDETVYYAHVPAQSVPGALEVLARSVFEPNLDAAQIALEREVVIEEILQYDDDPSSRAQETLMAQLYPTQALGRPILGTVKGLRSYRAAQLRAFHRRHYQAKNALVVVSGPVRPQSVLRHCQQIFGDLASPVRARRHPGRVRKGIEGPLSRARCKILRHDVAEVSVRSGYRGPALHDDQAVALDAAAVILGQGESSRLQRVLLREKALVSEVNAAFYLGPQSSTMQMALQCEAKQLHAATEALFEEIEKLVAEPCSASALARATAQLESSLVYRRETVEGLAHAAGWSLMVGEGDDAEQRYFQQLRDLTPQAVQEAVRTWLGRDRAAMSIVVPESQVDAKQAKALERTLLAPPKRAAKVKPRKGKAYGRCAKIYELAPGLTLLCRVDKRVPMLSGQWLANTGPYQVKPRKRGSFALLSRMLTRGTHEKDALHLAQEIEGWAASLEGVCGWRSVGVYFEGLTRNARGLLQHAGSCMRQPRLDRGDWEREKALLLDEMNAEQDDLAHQCIRAMRRALYGPHPLAEDRRGDAQSVSRSKYASLTAAHDALIHAPQVVSLAGDFDPDEIIAELQCQLAQEPAWGGGPSKVPELQTPRWPKKVSRKKIEKDRDQVHIAWGYPGLAIGDERAPCLELVLQVLGGQTGRLFTRMREREALVYAVSASAFVGAGAGHICVYAATAADKVALARNAVREEIESLVAKGPTQSELDRAKRSLVGQINSGLQRRGRMASGMAASYIMELDPDHSIKTRDAIEKARLGDVVQVAKALLGGPALAQVELGPPSAD